MGLAGAGFAGAVLAAAGFFAGVAGAAGFFSGAAASDPGSMTKESSRAVTPVNRWTIFNMFNELTVKRWQKRTSDVLRGARILNGQG